MNKFKFLAVGLAVAAVAGCATRDEVSSEPLLPSMTANLGLGVSADSILSKYGNPLYKKGRTGSDGKKLEEWFYADSILSFKDGSLDAFKPRMAPDN